MYQTSSDNLLFIKVPTEFNRNPFLTSKLPKSEMASASSLSLLPEDG